MNVVLGTVDEFSAIVTKEQELGSERAGRLFFTSFSLVQFSGQHFQGGHVCWARPLRRVGMFVFDVAGRVRGRVASARSPHRSLVSFYRDNKDNNKRGEMYH